MKFYLKKQKSLLFVILTSTSLLCSCKAKKQIEGFDADSWKGDKMGCKGLRHKLSANFETIRPQLKGLSQAEVLQLLGRPDFQQLHTRNQKFYIYFVEAGSQCQGELDQSKARTVVLRFNAVELLAEIYYETGKPK